MDFQFFPLVLELKQLKRFRHLELLSYEKIFRLKKIFRHLNLTAMHELYGPLGNINGFEITTKVNVAKAI